MMNSILVLVPSAFVISMGLSLLLWTTITRLDMLEASFAAIVITASSVATATGILSLGLLLTYLLNGGVG